MIRQPIVSVLGHIDHGKTSLLDRIRGTVVTAKEAGGITQHIGATEVPMDAVKNICGPLLLNIGVELTLPGFLFIDTPGHAAFNNLRKRGGSISDVGILVVDVTEGFKPQTHEALNILKAYKTPFLVVANKVDLFPGWQTNTDIPFLKSFRDQRDDTQQRLDTQLYLIVEELYKNHISSERFDRVSDFTNQVAVVPMSAKTGEGIPELLMVLSGLAQRYLEKELKVDTKGPGKGSILEVKKAEGLGTTIDVILYDGVVRSGDTIVVGTQGDSVVTKIKALLRPNPMEEIRLGKHFKPVDEVAAAAGIKIAAPGLETALAGAPLMVARSKEEAEQLKSEIKQEVASIQVQTEASGVVVKADTLGTLEALVKMLQDAGIVVRKAAFGDISKKDVADASVVAQEDKLKGVIFGFNVNANAEVEKEADKRGVRIFAGDVVYTLIESYQAWVKAEQEKSTSELMKEVTLPGKAQILPRHIFRESKPAVVGVEILEGVITSGVRLLNADGDKIGTVKEIQAESQSISKAEKGQRVAISIEGAIVGKHIKENDTVYVRLSPQDVRLLKGDLSQSISDADRALVLEIEALTEEEEQ